MKKVWVFSKNYLEDARFAVVADRILYFPDDFIAVIRFESHILVIKAKVVFYREREVGVGEATLFAEKYYDLSGVEYVEYAVEDLVLQDAKMLLRIQGLFNDRFRTEYKTRDKKMLGDDTILDFYM